MNSASSRKSSRQATRAANRWHLASAIAVVAASAIGSGVFALASCGNNASIPDARITTIDSRVVAIDGSVANSDAASYAADAHVNLPDAAPPDAALPATWNLLTTTHSANDGYEAAMAYDSVHHDAIRMGGSGSFGFGDGDTWSWDGSDWTDLAPVHSPGLIATESMAFDESNGKIVLFGGRVNGENGDNNKTWLWDGTDWSQQSPATSPSARDHAVMAYDSLHHQVILFGGFDGNSATLNDTWAWDGATWTQLTPTTTSPTARSQACMAFDSARGEMVLFGGTTTSETWTWDGSDWTLHSTSGAPPSRELCGMAFDVDRGQALLFGGLRNNVESDTWAWDGSQWTQLTLSTTPDPRYGANLVYDTANHRVVMFGGYGNTGPLSDTWYFGSP